MIRWGILGCGDVCERKSGPAFQRVPRSALVAVMRRDGDKAREFAARHGVPRAYDDADALIADPEVDAVYVATPPSSHAELALRVARAGKPCYVEKPMATTVAEAEAMRAAFAAAGGVCEYGRHRNTHHPGDGVDPRATWVNSVGADVSFPDASPDLLAVRAVARRLRLLRR